MNNNNVSDPEKVMIEQPINLKEACQFLGNISSSSIHKLIKQGKIKGYKVLSEWRFYKSELNDQIKNHE